MMNAVARHLLVAIVLVHLSLSALAARDYISSSPRQEQVAGDDFTNKVPERRVAGDDFTNDRRG